MRAGRAVRFVPYPVIGGFLGAAGWLIAAGAIQIMTGYRLRLSGLVNFLDPLTLAKFAAGAGVAAVLLFGRRRFKAPLAQPAMLLACAAAVYAGLALFGISLTQDRRRLDVPAAIGGRVFPGPDEWRGFRWHLLPALSADFTP